MKKASLPTPRQYLAEQYERGGLHSAAAKIRKGELPSEVSLRALRAIEAAQRDALAYRVRPSRS